jgi:hypothetical protein
MEYVWNNTVATREVLAGSAGAVRKGIGDVPEFQSLPKPTESGGIRRVGWARPAAGSEVNGPGQRV